VGRCSSPWRFHPRLDGGFLYNVTWRDAM
jgi:hypothetical protein